ncbi:MAG: hypothetical protein GXY03_14870 [Solirubrobacterales bacterium]|nr:hypothetical protein [Solirubrobacterales bacterium]
MDRSTKIAATVAAGRLAFGIGLLAALRRIASGWIGDDAGRPGPELVLRALGARDVALSVGALASVGDAPRLARWVGAAAGCDLADVAATLVAPADGLPANARWGTVALGGGTAALGLLALRGLRR